MRFYRAPTGIVTRMRQRRDIAAARIDHALTEEYKGFWGGAVLLEFHAEGLAGSAASGGGIMRSVFGLLGIVITIAIILLIYRSYFTGATGEAVTLGSNN